MRSLIGPSVCLLTLLGCAAPQPKPQSVAATATAQPAPLSEREQANKLIDKSIKTGEAIKTSDGQALICKQEMVTNTRLKNRKTCLTQDQWAARTDSAKDAFREAKSAGEYLPPKGN